MASRAPSTAAEFDKSTQPATTAFRGCRRNPCKSKNRAMSCAASRPLLVFDRFVLASITLTNPDLSNSQGRSAPPASRGGPRRGPPSSIAIREPLGGGGPGTKRGDLLRGGDRRRDLEERLVMITSSRRGGGDGPLRRERDRAGLLAAALACASSLFNSWSLNSLCLAISAALALRSSSALW
eukprot:CAMPEP_0204498926 /NCGR_PEP_ID=MMETSP0471-20130131/93967_1 /ASSEMBLY_ACC=CAM_ASM_000602 /TAXON_ID=2969 /ORGANISM="Oxyrrhis marina" /LENGTH=181 /DNA_ID=CAMNT_0051503429 /DNA_START=470 /DNA_END=1015 /DNA_ORIENTATION=+